MKNFFPVAVLLFVLASCGTGRKPTFAEAAPPVAMQKEHLRIIHGDTVDDPYYWMYDFFGKGPDSTAVINYLEAENDYLARVMKPTEGLRKKLYDEMRGRIIEADESVPVRRNGYYYYTRTEEGENYYKYCRKKGSLDAQEEVVFDVDRMAEGYAYYSLGGVAVSPDNRLALFGVDTVSRRQYTLYVKDLETGELLGEAIPNTVGSGTWSQDGKFFFYAVRNAVTLLPEKIMRHELGTSVGQDIPVYEEADNTNYLAVYKSKNSNYIIIESESTTSSEIRYLRADDPTGEFRVFQPRMDNVLYQVAPLDDGFLILTNLEALNFKVMTCSVGRTSVADWVDYIPHREDVLVESIEEFRDFVVVEERKEGLLNIRILNLLDKTQDYLDFGETSYTAFATGNTEYDTPYFRYRYTSLTTPSSTFDYNMATGEKVLLKEVKVLGGFDKNDYRTERLYATAADGTKVPISLVYKKGTRLDGTAPLYLSGYGSYGYSTDPVFSSSRLSLLNRGFVYAIAHVRGGQEMGRQWYEDGKLLNKINTFTDFIACAEHLIAENYTGSEHLYAGGGSAGGLLIGAVVNMRPDLWKAVVADVPFVDVVNTMLDEDIPLTTGEYDEWGNPNDPEYYWYMKSYSPYENVEPKDYPSILVITGLHDSQVQYFEPAKWVAKLRATKTDNNPVILYTNMDAGHGGASGRFDYLEEVALEFAFLLTHEGIGK